MSVAGAVRVGVIGTGFGARVVAPVFRDTGGCEVVDVVSPRDVPAVTALCARDDVDLISVHSPPFLHVDHVRQAVASGHAVLCDKPFGRNAEDSIEMRDLAHRAGVPNFVNYEFRVHPVRQRLRELVRDGAIGPVEHVQWTAWLGVWHPAAGRTYGWSFDADRGGGWVRVWGSHQIDYLRWTFGDITAATAALRTTVPERVDPDGHPRGCTAETGFTANLLSETGVAITLDSSATAPVERPSRVVVIGRDGVLEMRSDNPHEIGGWIELHTGAGSTEVFRLDQHGDNHRLEMAPYAEVVRDAIRNGDTGPDVPTFTDGVACSAIMDALTSRPDGVASADIVLKE